MTSDRVAHGEDVPLRRLSTIWTMVLQAHGGPLNAETSAQNRFVEYYRGAVYRYFRTALGSREAAEELFQEFAVRFIRGDLQRFDPRKGRFRDYLKTVLVNLIHNYRRRQAGGAVPLHIDVSASGGPSDDPSREPFEQSWSTELLAQAWSRLKEFEDETGQPFFTVLKFRVEHRGMKSAEMAELLTERLQPQQPWTATGLRKAVERARRKFAELLLEEVRQTLQNPSREELEEELSALGLLAYCRGAL